MGLRLNSYYAIYDWLGNSRRRYLAIRVARALGMRHLLVRLDTNFLCNLKCKTCYFSGPRIKEMLRAPMTEERFRVVAARVFPSTRILFLSCGGEPLMTKDFATFLDIASEYRVPYVGFITNALLFRKETVAAVMRNRVNEIIVSVDGASAKTYEYIRQGGRFDVLLEKLQMLMEARGQARLPDLRFNFTITRTNFRETVEIVEMARRFGISTIKFRHFTDWGGQFAFRDESLKGYEREFNRLLDATLSKAREYGIKVFAPEPFGHAGETKMKAKVRTVEELIDTTPRPPCIMPWYHLYVDPEGLTRPCAFLPLGFESLFDRTLSEIESGAENSARRRALLRDPRGSCLVTGCSGQILRRANDDSDYLAQYDESGRVNESLGRFTPGDGASPES